MKALVCWLVVALMPALAAGQGLGEAARREKERRAGKKPPARVYGDQDLDGGSAAGEARAEPAQGTSDVTGDAAASESSGGAASSSASTTGSSSADDAEAKARARAEESWRARASPVRAAYEAAESRVKRLEVQVAELEREGQKQAFIYGVRGTTAAATARERLEQARRELAEAGRAWEDFQDEARRAGVPPGWIR
jgi:hypothetical protein